MMTTLARDPRQQFDTTLQLSIYQNFTAPETDVCLPAPSPACKAESVVSGPAKNFQPHYQLLVSRAPQLEAIISEIGGRLEVTPSARYLPFGRRPRNSADEIKGRVHTRILSRKYLVLI